jgi:hypothetical protein
MNKLRIIAISHIFTEARIREHPTNIKNLRVVHEK